MASRSSNGRGEIDAAKQRLALAKKWKASFIKMLKAAEQDVVEAEQSLSDDDAKQCLALAKKWKASATKKKASATKMLKTAEQDVLEAEQSLNIAEQKWEVMDVDNLLIPTTSSQVNLKSEGAMDNDSEDGDETGATSKLVDHIGVTECDIQGVNGIYKMRGTCDGVANYRKTRENHDGKKYGSFVIYRCLIPDTRDRRRWYISNVPEGCHPGTEKDINYYSAEANFFDTVPPQTNWVDDHKGSPPIPRFCHWDHHGSMIDSNTKTEDQTSNASFAFSSSRGHKAHITEKVPPLPSHPLPSKRKVKRKRWEDFSY